MSLRPLGCRNCEFESRRKHGYQSLLSVMCFQVDVSESGWSFIQRSTIECGVSECDRETSTMRRIWPTTGCRAMKRNTCYYISLKNSLLVFLILSSLLYIYRWYAQTFTRSKYFVTEFSKTFLQVFIINISTCLLKIHIE